MSSSSKAPSACSSLWTRMRTPGHTWEDKDEFLDVIYWGRQILGVIMGFLWGIFGLTGFAGLASYVALNSAAVYVYSLHFNADTDDIMEPVKEGFMTAFSAFMVTWIMTYSAVFYDS